MNRIANSAKNSKSPPKIERSWLSRKWTWLAGRTWFTPRFDPIFEDGPSLAWLKTNVDAFRRFRGIRPRELTHIGLFAFSRGGSHLFESQFHTLQCGFCFGEGSLDFRTDLNWRTFLCRGMYRTDSIQSKSACDMTHLFYNCNNGAHVHLAKSQWTLQAAQEYHRKWILILRNPLRILMSRQARGKQKWRVTSDYAAAFVDGFERSRAEFRKLRERVPDDVDVLSVEQFAARPETVMNSVCSRLGIAADIVAGRPKPQEFFRRLGRTGERPVERDGYLKSPTWPIAVQGWGGRFNPIAPLNPDRLFKQDIAASLSNDALHAVRDRIGPRAFDLYMSDRDHRFAGMTAEDLLQ
jgi:hypothetical protein